VEADVVYHEGCATCIAYELCERRSLMVTAYS
jgi:hypothetical protein